MAIFKTANKAQTGESDPILTRLVNEDPVPWYKKPNLRFLYFMLFPTCMGIELTSGFDSQLINALQIVPTWIECKSSTLSFGHTVVATRRNLRPCVSFIVRVVSLTGH